MNTLNRHRLLVGTGLLVLLGGVTYSCKDFLQTEPQGTLDEGTLTNRAGVEGSLIAAYRALDWNTGVGGGWGNSASNWVWGSVTSDDAYKGSEATDQPGATDVELYNWTTGSAEDYLNDKWRGMYEGVVRSNATLRLLAKVRAQKPGEIDDATANSVEGEALFLRAHYHFELMRMWGTVAYYREDDTDFRKTNVGVNDTTEILADLDAAIAKLPDTPRDKGRAGKWTATAYKGRVQVYRRDYAGGKTTLDAVVASGRFGLETSFDHVWTGFQAFADGPETILAYHASANDGEPDGNNANWGERLNFPHSNSPFGCCGFHQPSQNLLNSFVVDQVTGLPKEWTDPNWNVRNATFVASVNDTLDPRVDWTVGRDNVPYKDWGLHLPTWIRAPGYGGPYSPKKHVHENASGAQSKVGGWGPPTQLNAVHIHIFRYADLLLLLAEADVETNDLPAALTIVNQIRTRAGVTAQGCGGAVNAAAQTILLNAYPTCAGDTRLAVPINDASIKWATYKVGTYPAFVDQPSARKAVQLERKLELAMEGQRFFDLRRWGTELQVINDYVLVEKNRRSYLGAAVAPLTAKYHLYPIPALQIELSKVGSESRLEQNPQW